MPPAPQSKTSLPEGWSLARPANLPRPTVAPAALSFGATFMLWGLVTSLLITLVGLAVFAWGVGRWIGDIRNERKML